VRIAAIALFAVAGFVAWFFVDTWRAVNLREWLFYDASYADLGGPWWSGAVRLALMAIALVLGRLLRPRAARHVLVDALRPVHDVRVPPALFVLYPLRETGVLRNAEPTWLWLPAVIAGSVLVALALATKPVRTVFRPHRAPAGMDVRRPHARGAEGRARSDRLETPPVTRRNTQARGAASAYRRDMSELNLPVLDLSQLDEGPDAAASFRAQLRAATHDVGFFYLTGTGVTPELEARLHRTARAFFELPEADKLAIENINSPQFRGYTRIGGERTQGEVDWREQIDIGPERGVVTDADAPDFARLIGPNLWPDAQPELREVATEWQEHLAGVARKLLRAWALALGAPETYFDEHFGEPATLLKIVRYPVHANPSPSKASARTRTRAFSLCSGSNPARAVCRSSATASGWTPVGARRVRRQHRRDARVRHGRLPHRNEPPRRVAAVPGRPHLRSVLLQSRPRRAAAAHRPSRRPRCRRAGVTQDPSNPIHSLYGENALKSRLRAHPDVAERWHADLVAARA
jgi:hypothetical protein